MSFTYRKSPVVEFPFTPKDQQLADVLQRTLGKLVSLTVQQGFYANSSTSVGTSGATNFLPGGLITVNLADAGIDEMRLVGYGKASSALSSLDYFSNTQGKVLCAMTGLSAGDAAFAGNWTKITPLNADEQCGLRITLALAQTAAFWRIDIQMRSSHFIG